MTNHARGTFDVTLLPQPPEENVGDATIGRLSIDKQFHGALDAHSSGQMLSVGTAVDGSAAYVAMERVSGTLDGRKGTFALQHTGILNRGVPHLTVTVVPDSGTDQLTGISGSMTIENTDGKHIYDFIYTLAESVTSV